MTIILELPQTVGLGINLGSFFEIEYGFPDATGTLTSVSMLCDIKIVTNLQNHILTLFPFPTHLPGDIHLNINIKVMFSLS